jgi:hypothetical protein
VDWVRVHTRSAEPAYPVTVNGGIGSGPYVAGTPVSVTAQMPPDGWVVDGPAQVDKSHAPSARLTVPAADVVVTAMYRPAR